MSYKSPIEIVEKMSSQMENDIMQTIISYGINVDKAELLKALTYDREQYEKGYADGQRAGERTVKVEQIPDEEETIWDVCECGADVYRAWIYCPYCGARLEWDE